ncbi:P-loop containing nucleoside triphosphate hydrolase protein [Pseudomassariella vexata]|uniref:Elongation factor 2 n=1 Tax=Pseudomassariella vexata TaxID=1141098 RepID=A0A1Y2E159_9PEZI|nr:P-loop containing nucleoside triphosphate hydrolase protein [Pseudomassariella vexata]ORY65219.1 P-loop containing nucleoside triphosphate hydrolase protein [Pseudomassariella vexata]
MSFLAIVTRARVRCPGRCPGRWPHTIRPRRLGLRAISTPPTSSETAIDDVRNIGIIAHVDAGKTTTTEAMLYNSGATRHLGNVDHGDTVTDFLPMERQRGITIQSAAITFKWPKKERLRAGGKEHIVNLIDTPGHQDFRFEVERCLPVLDGAVCVIDGVEGVEAHTERVWSSAQEFKVPRIVLVNKLDREGASFKKSVQDIGLKLNGMPLVCQIPWWENDTVKGIVDVISRSVVSWAGAGKDNLEELAKKTPPFLEEIERAREKLIEKLCEYDDVLLELWTERGGDIPSEDIKHSIRRSINNGEASLVPVFAGSSLKNIGVASLLDAVNDYLPSPRDRPELQVRVGQETHPFSRVLELSRTQKVPVKQRSTIEALASVFKVVNDPKRGMLTFVRVYHGMLKKNTPMWNANLQDFEKPLNIMQISAKDHIEVPQLLAGQIGALTGLKKARTGDTMLIYTGNKTPNPPFHNVKVRPPEIPPAVAFIVLEPYTSTGAKALEAALENLAREDPSLRWSLNENSEQYTLSGMGKLHLEVARDRLEKHYKLEAHWGSIEVDYKECVTQPTETHRVVFDKTIGGKAGAAACSVSVQPLELNENGSVADSDFERDGNIIRVLFPDNSFADNEDIRLHLMNGAVSALARGPRRTSPLHRCLVTVTFDASTDYFGPTPAGHYASAANQAVRTALREAHKNGSIGILEPVMRVVITCPESSAGSVQHDLHSSRGGHVLEVMDMQETAAREGSQIDVSDIYAPPDPYEFQTTLRETRKGSLRMLEIIAQVPLAEMLDYDQHLRSMTAGRHALVMSLDTFEQVTGSREKHL